MTEEAEGGGVPPKYYQAETSLGGTELWTAVSLEGFYFPDKERWGTGWRHSDRSSEKCPESQLMFKVELM